MIKRQWYWNLRETRVFFYEWVERCETGKAGICCVKKENVLWKVHSAVWHLFLFVRLLVLIFISSYQVKLGYLGLVLVDCRKFCALFLFLFFNLLRSFFPPSFSFWAFIFPKQILEFFFFSKISHFGIYLLGFLKFFSSLFLLLFWLSFIYFWGNCFLFQVQFHKRRTSTV